MTEENHQFLKKGENDNSIVDSFYNYLKHWHWFLFSLFVFTLIGYFYVRVQVPQYRAQTSIMISDNSQSSDKGLLTQLNINPSEFVIDNEIQVLRSMTLTTKVVKALSLETSYYRKGRFQKLLLYENLPFTVELILPSVKCWGIEQTVEPLDMHFALLNGKQVSLNKPISTDLGTIIIRTHGIFSKSKFNFIFTPIADVAKQYLGSLSITPVSKQGTVLVLTIQDAIMQRGKDFLNRLVLEYNLAGIQEKNKTISNTLAFIESRLSVLALELDSSERKVVNYKSSNNITDISVQAQGYLTNVTTNDEALTKIELQLGVLSNIENFLKVPIGNEVKLPSLLGMDDPTVGTLVKQLGDALFRREGLLRTIPETNPIVSSINDEIAAIKFALNQTVKNVKSGLSLTKAQLKTKSNSYNVGIKNIPSKERGLIDVMRQRDIKNNLFNFLLQKREETALSLAATISDSRTIDGADGSQVPVKPIKMNLYLMFLITGIFVPAMIIFVKNSLNNTIRKKEDIERITNVPIIAQIAHSVNEALVMSTANPKSVISEQIRSLRTNLDFLLPKPESKVILFTSSISGEGKSYIALNLGMSLSLTRKKVIVVECDVRKPKISATLNLKGVSEGLSNYLIGKATYQDIVTRIPGNDFMDVIVSGNIPPNPAELLLNGQVEILISELKKHYDYIIMDTPPIGLLTDAQILSKYADLTFFIVRYNYTIKKYLSLLQELYEKKIFKNLNLIFNSVDISVMNYYGYGYGYYEESDSKNRVWFKSLFNR